MSVSAPHVWLLEFIGTVIIIYIYIIQIVCVCVRVCVRACVCLSRIGGKTAGPIMTKFGTYIYVDRSGNGSYLKKLVPRMVQKGGLIGAILRSGYLAGGQQHSEQCQRAVSQTT